MTFAAIGDSLTQGFQSGATKKTEWSFPAIVARAMGLRVGFDEAAEFRVPEIPGDGLPLNLEIMLRRLQTDLGKDIAGADWLRFLPGVARHIDSQEGFYERRSGAEPSGFRGAYHNLGIFGATMFEATNLDREVSERIVKAEEGWIDDDPLGLPAAAQYRIASAVLDPARDPRRKHATQLDNLEYLVRGNAELGIAAEPMDAVLLWLGANDCLRTMVTLEVKDMERAWGSISTDVHGRRRYNLTSEAQFAADADAVARRLDDVLAGTGTQVFVGTVPDVTIPPVSRGFGDLRDDVFDLYSRFFLKESTFAGPIDRSVARLVHRTLVRAQVENVRARIAGFNRALRALAAARPHWHVVDVAGTLDQFAVRRRGFDRDPGRALREYYSSKPNHPLLSLSPTPSVLMLATDELGRRTGGGLTSLDGIHPSTIAYGIVAELFLEAMQNAGVAGADPSNVPWADVIAADGLVLTAPMIWDDVVDGAERCPLFWEAVLRAAGSEFG